MAATDFQNIDDKDRDHLKKFLDIMLPTKMHCRPGDNHWSPWVFWKSEEEDESLQTIPSRYVNSRAKSKAFNDSIKTWLLQIHHPWAYISGSCLIQFWMVKSKTYLEENKNNDDSCLVLNASDQPFAVFGVADEELMHYRKHIMSRGDIRLDMNLVSQQQPQPQPQPIGIPGRVFLSCLPEYSVDIGCYQLNEFPLRDEAVKCGFNQCFALPLFKIATQKCVGVLEFLYTNHYATGYTLWNTIKEKREIGCLKAHLCDTIVVNEVWTVVNEVCRAHNLSIAIGWAFLKDTMVKFNGRPRKLLIPMFQTFCDYPPIYFVQVEAGQGLVGKTFSSKIHHFCKDVTKLRIDDYPLAHYVRIKDLSSSFAFFLKGKAPRTKDVVVEFFSSKDKACSENPQILVSSILHKMKKRFRRFDVALGEERKELFIEIDEYSSSKYYNDTMKVQREALPSDVKVVNQGIVDHQLMITSEHLSEDIQNVMHEDNKKPDTALRNQGSKSKMEPPCSQEELQRYFGVVTIMEFAEKHRVGRSTVKRWCRYYGFKKWPRVHRSVPKSAQDSENVHTSKEPILNDDNDAPSHLVCVSNQGPTSDDHEIQDLAAIRDTRKKQKLNNTLKNVVDLEERAENEAPAPLNELQQESFRSMNGPQRNLLQWFVFNKAGDMRELLVDFQYECLLREDILMSLTPKAWFNDNVINTVASMLTTQELRLSNNSQSRRTWYLPTYIHGKLCNDPVDFKSIYDHYNWYMGDLRTCEKIFIPVNEMSRHWYICSIDLKNEVIEVLDSFPNQGCCSRMREVIKLRKRFVELLRYIGGTEDDVLKLECLGIKSPGWVPNQENDYDCGLFVIKFMHEEFGPDKLFKKLDSKAERVKLAIDMVLHEDNKQRQKILGKVIDFVPLIEACGGNWEILAQVN